jgi:hypothetical protein
MNASYSVEAKRSVETTATSNVKDDAAPASSQRSNYYKMPNNEENQGHQKGKKETKEDSWLAEDTTDEGYAVLNHVRAAVGKPTLEITKLRTYYKDDEEELNDTEEEQENKKMISAAYKRKLTRKQVMKKKHPRKMFIESDCSEASNGHCSSGVSSEEDNDDDDDDDEVEMDDQSEQKRESNAVKSKHEKPRNKKQSAPQKKSEHDTDNSDDESVVDIEELVRHGKTCFAWMFVLCLIHLFSEFEMRDQLTF